MQDLTGGRRVEYLIDASGVGSLFREIPGLLRKQATVLLYGHGHAGVDLSVLNNVQFLEPTLVSPVGASGGFLADGRPATYRRALDLIESGARGGRADPHAPLHVARPGARGVRRAQHRARLRQGDRRDVDGEATRIGTRTGRERGAEAGRTRRTRCAMRL